MRLAFLVCALSVAVGGSTLFACSCRRPPAPKKALEQSVAVFSGKVTAIEKNGFSLNVTFSIERTWKGTAGKTIVVANPSSGAACGNSFKMGQSYLVYCYKVQKPKEGDPLRTNLCTRTKSLKAAKADIKEIGPGKKPKG